MVPGADFFFTAYRDLVTCRHPDGAIPWTAAKEYADHKRMAPDVFDAIWIVVHELDIASRQWEIDNIKSGD